MGDFLVLISIEIQHWNPHFERFGPCLALATTRYAAGISLSISVLGPGFPPPHDERLFNSSGSIKAIPEPKLIWFSTSTSFHPSAGAGDWVIIAQSPWLTLAIPSLRKRIEDLHDVKHMN